MSVPSIRNLLAASARPLVERTQDADAVREIITHPHVYGQVRDDGSPAIWDYQPDMDERNIYLISKAGVFCFYPYNSVTYDSHVCVLPEYRGRSLPYGKAALAWMFTNTDCLKVIGKIPSFNKRAIAWTKKLGFEVEGLMKKAFLKKSELHDLVVMGVSCL